MPDDKRDIDDVMPYLMGDKTPLWEGRDDGFAAYVHSTFGVPETLTRITITPRTERGRSAVAIASNDGAIVYVLSHDYTSKKLETTVVHMGPIVSRPEIMRRAAAAAKDTGAVQALSSLVTGALGEVAALDLLAPAVH